MSMNIDTNKCTGCGTCIGACPQQAISVIDNLATIDRNLCIECGKCAAVCPSGAIRRMVPALREPAKGEWRTCYGYRRGFGSRGSSPPLPYIGRGRGGMRHHRYPGLYGGRAASYSPSPVPALNEELGSLKEQAATVKKRLDWISKRIHNL